MTITSKKVVGRKVTAIKAKPLAKSAKTSTITRGKLSTRKGVK